MVLSLDAADQKIATRINARGFDFPTM